MHLKTVTLFANKNEDGIYGDIYSSAEECLKEHPNDVVLVGFGVMDADTGFCVDESDDFYATEEDAQLFIDEKAPACQMHAGCTEPVTHLDKSGFLYCTTHGLQRRASRPCRKLRPHELTRLANGGQITKY
jgi:hypothetical protein